MEQKIKVTSVLSNTTTIISESPTVLLLAVTGNLQHLGYNFTHKVIVDFNRLDMSLREAAVEITDNSIISGDYHSKRSLQYIRQTEENNNKLQFQARCTDLIEYIKIINESIAMLESLTTNPINNVAKGRKGLTEYTALLTKPITFETGKISVTLL